MPSELEPFSNAPISEAVIDIRFTSNAAPTFEELSKFVSAIKDDYPIADQVGEIRAELRSDSEFDDKPRFSHTTSTTPLGYRCVSANKKLIAQVSSRGFVFSQLRPYDRWSTFKEEAKRLFDTYLNQLGNREIKRVAIRTINRLDIPNTIVDFKDWIRTGPEISPDLPQGLTAFFLQIQQPYEDVKSYCIINETMVPPEVPDTVAVILDIDLFRIQDIPQETGAFWRLLDEMRSKKK
jgi:uncharacterized protein (TIGR04255 family)